MTILWSVTPVWTLVAQAQSVKNACSHCHRVSHERHSTLSLLCPSHQPPHEMPPPRCCHWSYLPTNSPTKALVPLKPLPLPTKLPTDVISPLVQVVIFDKFDFVEILAKSELRRGKEQGWEAWWEVTETWTGLVLSWGSWWQMEKKKFNGELTTVRRVVASDRSGRLCCVLRGKVGGRSRVPFLLIFYQKCHAHTSKCRCDLTGEGVVQICTWVWSLHPAAPAMAAEGCLVHAALESYIQEVSYYAQVTKMHAVDGLLL